jgi:hypothetical protein
MLTNAAEPAQGMTTSRTDNGAANRKCGDQALGVEKENLMLCIKQGAALLVGAAMGLGVVGASAADMPVKAPPPVTPFVLDVHGFVDVTFANTRVTGGGLYLYPNGTLSQAQTGLSLDVYKSPTGFINSFSVFAGIWNEAWSSPPDGVRKWQEMDWWAGFSVGFAQHWKLSVQYLEFVFPSGLQTAQNYVFTLGYDDSHWGLPFTINPYVTLFYNYKSSSTVVYGKRGETYRVEIGVVPTLNLQRTANIPLTITVPTSVTVGPSEFWNRNDGTTNVCGPTDSLPCELSNLAFVTTGLQGKYLLSEFIPRRLGTWYVKAGVQYYHIFNDALLAAQVAVGSSPSYSAAKRDITLVNGGFGFTF